MTQMEQTKAGINKVRHNMLKKALAFAAAGSLLAFTANAGTPLYETGFETNGDPSGASYTLGALDGQGAVGAFSGWQVTPSGSANVVASPLTPQSGDNYVEQNGGSEITANLPHVSPRMLVRAFHNGAGATIPTNPTPGVDAAAVLAFRAIDASNYTVAAWDGGGSQFVEPNPVVQLATTDWHEVLLGVNYGDKVYHVSVDGSPYLNTLGFFNNTVTQFNGFRASTTVGANIDTVGFFPSNGDYDGDGFGDDIEMTMADGDPLNAAVNPDFGDVNIDGSVNLVDALLHFRASSALIPTTGLNLDDDINGNGMFGNATPDLGDAVTLYSFLTNPGVTPVIPPL